MWQTSCGERILTGAEAELVRESMAYMVAMLNEEARGYADHWEFGVPVFDRLSWQQQFAVLADVGEALFREDFAPPELSAINEGTVGAIFENVSQCVQFEVDSDDPEICEGIDMKVWRRLVLAAQAEYETAPPACPEDRLPEPDCKDMEEWDLLVECLSQTILWDADWLDEDLYMDVTPELSRARKKKLSIADKYFTAIAPDPSEAELPAIRQRLDHLLHS
jgi:hypothetical protein